MSSSQKIPLLYFNPRCSKCRIGKEYLKEKQIETRIIDYIAEGITKEELEPIFEKYKGNYLDLVRPKDFKDAFNCHPKDVSKETLIARIVENPRVMQRPLLVTESDVKIGRPFEI